MHNVQDAAVPLLAAGQTAATKDVLNRAFVELAKVRTLLLFACLQPADAARAPLH
jgi:hypothetical protein